MTATTGETPYVRYGEWVIWASTVALAGALAVRVADAGGDRSFIDSPGPTTDEPGSAGTRVRGDEIGAPYPPAREAPGNV